MEYLIGRLRIGSISNIKNNDNLLFLKELIKDLETDDKCIIVGNIFENDENVKAKDFTKAYNLFLNIKNKTVIEIVCKYDEHSYTKILADILNIKITIPNEKYLYRSGVETKKIGNVYTLACPYYTEGEKRNSIFGYFKGFDNKFEFIENINSSKIINILINEKTDLKKIKDLVESKTKDIIKVELEENLMKKIESDKNTDLILILNKDNVETEKRKSLLNLEASNNIDFTPSKNFYLKLLISIIKNKEELDDIKKKNYINILKKISI